MAGPAAKPRGGEKLRREESKKRGGRGGRGGEGITAREDQQMEVFGMLFNYTCKFEKSLKDEAQETGSPFRTASFLISHFFFFLDGSSVTTNALRRHDMNIQLTRGTAPRIPSVTLL